jgi:hypothetical protein
MANEDRSCSVCQKNASEVPGALQRCGRCHDRLYCSLECQKSDWKQHKKTCGKKPHDESDDVLSVRLECARDGNGFRKARISGNHPVFDQRILPVPGLIGIPLVIYKEVTNPV